MTDPITPLTPAQETLQGEAAAKEGYVKRVLVATDQFFNVLTGGLPDETISSRSARWDTEDTGAKHKAGKAMSEVLDLFQKDHGAKAEVGDLTRAEIVAHAEESTGTLPKQGD